jgi:hypothetical protein
MQRMKARAGVQWKDVSRGLGINRRQWGAKFHRWFDAQVEATPPLFNEPDLEDFPLGWDVGYQPDRTSASGGCVLCAASVTTC